MQFYLRTQIYIHIKYSFNFFNIEFLLENWKNMFFYFKQICSDFHNIALLLNKKRWTMKKIYIFSHYANASMNGCSLLCRVFLFLKKKPDELKKIHFLINYQWRRNINHGVMRNSNGRNNINKRRKIYYIYIFESIFPSIFSHWAIVFSYCKKNKKECTVNFLRNNKLCAVNSGRKHSYEID